MKNIEFKHDELISAPETRVLATGKQVLAFRVLKSDKSKNLNSGDRFNYEDAIYQILNRENVQSKPNYFKFNCVIQGIVND